MSKFKFIPGEGGRLTTLFHEDRFIHAFYVDDLPDLATAAQAALAEQNSGVIGGTNSLGVALDGLNGISPSVFRAAPAMQYDTAFGDERECKCGHSYYRHFDSYDDMEPAGCKYCQCFTFEEACHQPQAQRREA